jgi:hypothetical protein
MLLPHAFMHGRTTVGRFGLKGRNAQTPTLIIDPCMGDVPARELRTAALDGNWQFVREFLMNVDDPDDRYFYLNVAADLPGPQPWVERWTNAEPTSALALLVRGTHEVHWAWQARSARHAKYVSAEQRQTFVDRLRVAETHLDESAELDPSDPAPWAQLISCGMGRQVGPVEAMRRFNAVTARHRWHIGAHLRMLQQLCVKWGGSHEEMHKFAEETVATMPAGCGLGSLIAWAHFEEWTRLPAEEKGGYISRPEVATSIASAADLSVRHPDYVRRPGWPNAHAIFACTFNTTEQWAAAAEQFDVLGDVVTILPWIYFSLGPVHKFERTRRETYARVGR